MIQPSHSGIAGGAVAWNRTSVVAGPRGPSTAMSRNQVPCTGTSAAPWTPPGTEGSAATESFTFVAETPGPGREVTANVSPPGCPTGAIAKGTANPARAGSVYRLTRSGYGPASTWTTRTGWLPWVVAATVKPISISTAASATRPTANSRRWAYRGIRPPPRH